MSLHCSVKNKTKQQTLNFQALLLKTDQLRNFHKARIRISEYKLGFML